MVIEGLLNRIKSGQNISTDTRKIKEGDLFFALKGANFDGNKYARAALDAGASVVVVDDPSSIEKGNPAYILVENVLKTLQDLARAYRKTFSIPVIGITGSNGKTTSKELVNAVLSTEKKVHATAGNFNNHIGVPLTLLSMPADTEIAVIEMGANQPGDIEELVDIALPTHGYITNIGNAHIEKLGSQEGVFQTKTALFRFLNLHDGLIWLNLDDPWLKKLENSLKHIVTFGGTKGSFQIKDAQLFADHSELQITHSKEGFHLNISTPIIGRHNLQNVLLAVAVGRTMGITPGSIKKGIEEYRPENNRTQLIERGGLRILMDAYNANPSSMKAAIDAIFELDYKNIALVLGDMFELGPQSPSFHKEIGVNINQYSPTMTVLIGKDMMNAYSEIEGSKAHFNSAEDAGESIKDLLKAADLVLIKGSRGMALEKLLDFL